MTLPQIKLLFIACIILSHNFSKLVFLLIFFFFKSLKRVINCSLKGKCHINLCPRVFHGEDEWVV